MSEPGDDAGLSGLGAAFSRDEVLGGMHSRRAQTLLFAIEGRTARLAERSRKAMATYVSEPAQVERERVFLAALADARENIDVAPQDLERYAPDWASLVPHDAETTAALAAAIADKYAFRRSDVPALITALRLDDADVGTAFERQQGHGIDALFKADRDRREDLRWRQSRISGRLESLPPTWTAFALTLTEFLGAGVVALPIAFAAVGPAAAVVLLIAFGLLNMITVAALVESITRTGNMRFGSTYMGSFVGEYLGRPGKLAITVAFATFHALVVAVLILGFGTTLGDVTGTPPEIWAAVLAVAVILILRRESLDATVASVLIVGTVNIIVMGAIVVLAAGSIDIAEVDLLGAPEGASATAVLGLVFGTVLIAYYGHSSASNAAKVVLARDPSGKSLLKGNVLALATVTVMYIVIVVVTLAVVPADDLIGYDGTALAPLAQATGPLVAVLGVVFVVLALGLSALHQGLGLFNQVGEWLPRPRPNESSPLRALMADQRARSAIKAAPVIVMLIIVEVLLLTDNASFVEAVSFLGTIMLPLLAGLFPMLLLLAARRRGEYLPGRTIGIFGSPLVAVLVSAVFMGGLVLHGLVIWDDLIPRVLALAVAGVMSVLVAYSIRDGAFRGRLVAELVIDSGRPSLASLSAVVAGRRGQVPVSWATDETEREAVNTAELGEAARLGTVELDLPMGGPTAIRTWVHAIDEEGESSAWPATVVIEGSGRSYALEHDERGIADIEIEGSAGMTMRITPSEDGGGKSG